jgi:hypothetical protein
MVFLSQQGAIVLVCRVDLRRGIQGKDLLMDAVVQLPGIA